MTSLLLALSIFTTVVNAGDSGVKVVHAAKAVHHHFVKPVYHHTVLPVAHELKKTVQEKKQ